VKRGADVSLHTAFLWSKGEKLANRNFSRFPIWLLVIVLSLLLVGCSNPVGTNPTPSPWGKSTPVDPVFKEFYSLLGGSAVLGPAIHTKETRADNVQCQFTERALMCYNPGKTGSQRLYLDQLGRKLIFEPETSLTESQPPAGARVVKGVTIYEKFLPLYDQLYGATYVGEPLTGLRINYDLRRVEQFFTNVGFYQSLENPNGPVFLIPYGAYLCGGTCGYSTVDYWLTIKSNLMDQPFAPYIARMGGSAVFGTPLLQPEVAGDMLRQVYTNIIIQAPRDNLSNVSLYPVPYDMGYRPAPMEQKISHEQLVFFTLNKETGEGFNVPLPFEQFLGEHGGVVFAGYPTQPVLQIPGQNLYQQCFEKVCLIYDPAASPSMKVRLAPLGKEYLERFGYNPALEVKNIFAADRINMVVSVDRANLSSSEEQSLRMAVEEVGTMEGLPFVEASVVLTIPNKDPVRIYFPPTDESGMSVVLIPPMPELPNNTRVLYEVCLNLPSDRPICGQDSYLIWNAR
jgi:hypothetical protein